MQRSILALGLAIACTTPIASAQGNQQLNLSYPPSPRFTLTGKVWPVNHGEARVCLWKDDKVAAYSITIDDNIPWDHAWWEAQSQEYGWNFTWFVMVHPYLWDVLNNSPGTNPSFGPLSAFLSLENAGHDIQLHGSCVINTFSPSLYQRVATDSIDLMEGQATQRDVITYAYPCGTIGQGGSGTAYQSVASNLMMAARGTTSLPNHANHTNYMNVGGHTVFDLPSTSWFPTLARELEKILSPTSYKNGLFWRGWIVAVYHQVANRDASLMWFDHLRELEDDLWIAPFTDVAMYGQSRDTHSLEVTGVTSTAIRFTLSDDMLDSVYTGPLTVKVRVDDAWPSIRATQAGEPIAVTRIQNGGKGYALVEAVPDAGEVLLRRGPRNAQPPEPRPILTLHTSSASPSAGGRTGGSRAATLGSGTQKASKNRRPETLPTVGFRNAGRNVVAYSAKPSVRGRSWDVTVDPSAAGHAYAQVVGHLESTETLLRDGQALLVSGKRLFASPWFTSTWSATVPESPSLAGLSIHTQAVLAGGAAPFALTNAQDLVVGR